MTRWDFRLSRRWGIWPLLSWVRCCVVRCILTDVTKVPLSFIFMPAYNGFIGCPRNVCIPCLWDPCTCLPGDMSRVDRAHWANISFQNVNLHHTTKSQYVVWRSCHILPDWALNMDGKSIIARIGWYVPSFFSVQSDSVTSILCILLNRNVWL